MAEETKDEQKPDVIDPFDFSEPSERTTEKSGGDETVSKDPEVTEKTGEEDTVKPAESETKEPEKKEITVEERLAVLEKENQGYKSGMLAERKQRQDAQAQAKEIRDLLASIIEKRNAAKGEVEPKEKPPEPEKIPIQIDESGTPYLTADQIEKLAARTMKPVEERIQKTDDEKKAADEARLKQEESVRLVREVVGEDKDGTLKFSDSFNELYQVHGWLNQMFGHHLQANGLKPPTTAEQALEMIEGTPVEAEFKKQFPNADIDRVVHAFNGTKRSLRVALKSFSEARTARETAAPEEAEKDKAPEKTGLDKSLKDLAKKPSTLAAVRNQKGAVGKTLKDLANELDAFDFSPASEAAFKEVRKIARKEMG